jgi:hypothetical protein
MPSDSDGPVPPGAWAVHATAVAIGDKALLIRGASKAGKSTLALALIGASTAGLPILLVGDDRVLLSWRGDDLVVAPHPRIAGLIEKRGQGILAMPFRTEVPLLGIVDLGIAESPPPRHAGTCDLGGKNFPALSFVVESTWDRRSATVLEWFAATSAAHSPLKWGVNRLQS